MSARIVGEVFNTENDGLQILTGAGPDVRAETFSVVVKPGTDVAGYADALNAVLKPLHAQALPVRTGTADLIVVIDALAALLTLMLVAVAGLGVLNTVVLETRERVRDLGVYKALGMAPRQVIVMVVASVVVTGVAGGLAGTVGGVFLQRLVVGGMGRTAGFRLPASVLDVYGAGDLVVFGVGGLIIAVLGALLPAGWAARTRTAVALRTE